MVGCCVEKMITWLVVNGLIQEHDRELYRYAIKSFLYLVAPLFLSFVLGLWLGCLSQGIVMVIPFMMTRKFCGGYHAKQEGICFVGSSLLLFLCMELALHTRGGWLLIVITCCASLCLAIFSPLDNENRRLSDDEIKLYRRMVRKVVFLFLIVDVLLLIYEQQVYSVFWSVGILLTAGLQIPCVYVKWFGKKKLIYSHISSDL